MVNAVDEERLWIHVVLMGKDDLGVCARDEATLSNFERRRHYTSSHLPFGLIVYHSTQALMSLIFMT